MAPVVFRLLQLILLELACSLPGLQNVGRDGNRLARQRGAVEMEIHKLHIPAYHAKIGPRDQKLALHPMTAGVILQICLRGGPDDRGAESQGKGADGHDPVHGQIVFKKQGRPIRAAVFLQRMTQRLAGKAGVLSVRTACPEELLRRLSGAPHGDGKRAQLAHGLEKSDVVFPRLGNAIGRRRHGSCPLCFSLSLI